LQVRPRLKTRSVALLIEDAMIAQLAGEVRQLRRRNVQLETRLQRLVRFFN
jgi:ubiquinone biosynthesis protein UbiJ